MEQQQRNKIAWVLAVVLVPLLIYLVATNIAKVRKKSPARPRTTAVAAVQPVNPPDAGVAPAPVHPKLSVDSKVLAEQERIAALLPDSNPFNPARSAGTEPSSADAVPKTPAAPIAPPPPPAAPNAGIKLAAIMARGGGRMAMINGRLLGEGDRIAEWTIIKVTATEVLLDNGAEKKVLKLR